MYKTMTLYKLYAVEMYVVGYHVIKYTEFLNMDLLNPHQAFDSLFLTVGLYFEPML